MFKNRVSSSGHVKRMSSRRMGDLSRVLHIIHMGAQKEYSYPCTLSADACPKDGALLFKFFSRKSSIDLRLSLKPRRFMIRLVEACGEALE